MKLCNEVVWLDSYEYHEMLTTLRQQQKGSVIKI